MRGKHVSKPIEEVIREAKELVRDGVRELILVAQDTTYYGLDLYGEVRLAELLRELDAARRARVDSHPLRLPDLLHRRADRDAGQQRRRVVPYLDMPLQHINDRMLRRMQRRVATRRDRSAARPAARRRIPSLAMRTTFIVGFPGETEDEFDELCDFVQEAKFERLGVFPYSLEPGTPAERLPDHLPEEVKLARRDRLMEIAAGQSPSRHAAGPGRQGDRRSSSTAPTPKCRATSWRGRQPTRRTSTASSASRARTSGPATWCGHASPGPTATT